ncbi:MAG: hypothetical protein GX633_10640, partial [Clostridiales bacterium]|nr:hypothetical protein [Clostridiales bacterium]
MKSVKSLLALLLCLMMLVSLFAGCQKNEADDAPVSDTATEEKKEETKKEEPKKEEPKKEEPKKEEAKAEEKKEEAAPSNESEHVELSFVWTNWNNKSAEDDDVFAWMEERFNCDFEWINLASDIRTEKLGVMWASGDKFTASFGLNGTGNASCLQVQYDNDWIWALDDFLDSCPIIAAETADECWAYTRMSDGKIYGIPEQGCEVKTGLWVRQDWLGKVGLDLPKTIDDLEVVMDAFHNGDPDGDGVADTYGAVALFANFSSYDHYILSAFLPYGDSWQPISDSDNTLYPKFMHPDYKGYLSTLADWKQ